MPTSQMEHISQSKNNTLHEGSKKSHSKKKSSQHKNRKERDSVQSNVPGTDYAAKRAKEKERTDSIQKNIEEVIIQMDQNVDKAVKRGERLDEMEKTSYELQEEAKIFSANTSRARRNLWWKSKKTTIIIIIVVFVLLAVITVILVLRFLPGRII